MVYLLSGALVIFNYIKSNSKKAFLALAILLWCLMGWCYENADTMVYSVGYRYPSMIQRELLFKGIIIICNNLGMTFEQYRVVLTGIFLSILIVTIYRYSTNPNKVLALYCFFPFLFDAVQLRQFCANSIVIAITMMLYTKQNRKSFIVYGVGLVCATMLHVSAVYWLVAFLPMIMSYRYIIVFTASLNVGILLLYQRELLLRVLSLLGLGGRADSIVKNFYRSSFIQQRNYAVVFLIAFIGAVILLLYIRQFYSNKILVDRIIKLHILSLLLLQLIIRGAIDFSRLQYPLIVMTYIAISVERNTYEDLAGNSKKDGVMVLRFSKSWLLYDSCCLLYSAALLYLWILRTTLFETVFIPVLNNNLFFMNIGQ